MRRPRRRMRGPRGNAVHDEIFSGVARTSCVEYGCTPVAEPSSPTSEPSESQLAKYEDLEDD